MAIEDQAYFDRHAHLHTELRRLFQELDSVSVLDVFLYGGYSRFDGAIQDDGSFYNDIDILIVLKDWFSKCPNIDDLVDRICKVTRLKNIDVTVTNPMKMRLWVKSIFLYDLKHKGLLIYGSGKSLDAIRSFPATKIDYVSEAYIQASTRAYCILKPTLMFYSGPLTERELLFVNYQFSKLVISCIDSELLHRGQYETELHAKIIACEKIENIGKLKDLSTWAANFKKHPRLENILARSYSDSMVFFELYFSYFQSLFKYSDKFSFRDLMSSRSRKNKKLARAQFKLLDALKQNEFDLECWVEMEKLQNKESISSSKHSVKLIEALKIVVQLRELHG